MCCSEVPHPCCTVEACCDAWLEEGLDQEPAEEERGRPVQLYQFSPQRPSYPMIQSAASDPPPPLNAHGRWVLKE
jgi:hypothetical protein